MMVTYTMAEKVTGTVVQVAYLAATRSLYLECTPLQQVNVA
jgi:hypothetical protein